MDALRYEDRNGLSSHRWLGGFRGMGRTRTAPGQRFGRGAGIPLPLAYWHELLLQGDVRHHLTVEGKSREEARHSWLRCEP
jgi:hypothetical protein